MVLNQKKELEKENKLLKETLEKREKLNRDLLNYIKLIMYKCNKTSIEVEREDLHKLREYEIYIEDHVWKDTKLIKLILLGGIIFTDEKNERIGGIL